jgi:hypothetical protein
VCPADPGRWHYPDPHNRPDISTSSSAAVESSSSEGEEDVPARPVAAAPYRTAVCSQVPAAEALRAQLELCAALSRWRPFEKPSDEMVRAVETAATMSDGWMCNTSPAERCQRRAEAAQELAYEEAFAPYMPPELRYQRFAKYRLTNALSKGGQKFKGRQRSSLLETGRHLDRDIIQQQLKTPCQRGRSVHGPGCQACCGVGSFALQDVLQWRVLWASLPASTRSQCLLEYAKTALAKSTGDDFSKQVIQYQFFGKNVCKAAFLALSGIGSSSLENARVGALQQKENCTTIVELGLTRSLLATNKDNVYLGVRQWLEWYAAAHAELSSQDFKAYLPAGRKITYFYSYRVDMLKPGRGMWPENSPLEVLRREQQPGKEDGVASENLFLRVWRWEVPWLIVHSCKCMFTSCSVCSYLTLLIQQCPRSAWDRLEFLKTRLGNHFQFQASHRKQCPPSAFLMFQSLITVFLIISCSRKTPRDALLYIYIYRRRFCMDCLSSYLL